jgi:hypothetical protein
MLLDPYQGDTHNDATNCTICLEPVTSDQLVRLRCGHMFHQVCIGQAEQYQGKCPNCRTPIEYEFAPFHSTFDGSAFAAPDDPDSVAPEGVQRLHNVTVLPSASPKRTTRSFSMPPSISRMTTSMHMAETPSTR